MPAAFARSSSGVDGAGLGEGSDPDLVDGGDVRRVAALHRGQQPLLVFRIGDGRDLDLDVGVLGLEALDRLLLILAEAGFGLLVVPEFQRHLILGKGRAGERGKARREQKSVFSFIMVPPIGKRWVGSGCGRAACGRARRRSGSRRAERLGDGVSAMLTTLPCAASCEPVGRQRAGIGDHLGHRARSAQCGGWRRCRPANGRPERTRLARRLGKPPRRQRQPFVAGGGAEAGGEAVDRQEGAVDAQRLEQRAEAGADQAAVAAGRIRRWSG